MHFSSLTISDLVFGIGPDGAGGAGSDDVRDLALARTRSWLTFGGLRWMPRMAISEQCTAPHMFRQHASEMRQYAGSFMSAKYSYRSSITALTMPDASVAGVWQWIQPLGVHRVADGVAGAPDR